MSTDILIGGKRLTDKIVSYSATEYATPLDPSDMSGGAGQITVVAEKQPETRFVRRKRIEVVDGQHGTTYGTISSTSSANDFADTLTADSPLIALAYTRTAAPFSGTLGDLLRYYLGLVGLTDVIIDANIDPRPFTAPGWTGVVFDAIKRICAAERIELSFVADSVVVREVRQRIANNKRDSAVSVSVDDTRLASAVEVFYIHSVARHASTLIYPAGGWSEEDKIISVGANEVEEVEIDLDPGSGNEGLGVSIESLVQPVCQDFVGREVVDASVYCVMGNDGKPIPAARWESMGGSLEVEIGEDTRSLIVRVTGSSEEELAPFRIAATAGDSHNYSSLRVMGAGVVFDRRMIRAETGHSSDIAAQEVLQVESDFIVGIDSAWKALFATFATATGPHSSISVTTRGINRQKDASIAQSPTIGNFNAMYAGQTIGDFNTEWSGKTIADVNKMLFDSVALTFQNQAFGNIAGARVLHDGCWYRIVEGAVNFGQVTYTAVRDTTIGDWNTHYAGKTIGDFNALASGKTLGELALQPLLT